MSYYLDIFSPETFENFLKSSQDITGFRIRQSSAAKKIHPGDKLICYMTKLSAWVGILEVLSESFVDETPRFYEKNDPFVVRFLVKPLVWLPKEKAVPIREDFVWDRLSFTKGHDRHGSAWTGLFRSSLNRINDSDGKFLEDLLVSQASNGKTYPVDEAIYRKWLSQRIKRLEGEVTVSVPENMEAEKIEPRDEVSVREVHQGAILACNHWREDGVQNLDPPFRSFESASRVEARS